MDINIKPQAVLYEYNNIEGYSFSTDIETLTKVEKFFNKSYLTHRLEYFREFDGETDVIRYSRCNNSEIVSYYTIRNGIALCGFMKDGEICWEYMEGMTNFVIPRFKAFKDNGITFATEEINDLFNKKTYIRTKNR